MIKIIRRITTLLKQYFAMSKSIDNRVFKDIDEGVCSETSNY